MTPNSNADSVSGLVWVRRAARASGLFWMAVPNSRAVAERISTGPSIMIGWNISDLGAWMVTGWSVSIILWIREPSWARARPQS